MGTDVTPKELAEMMGAGMAGILRSPVGEEGSTLGMCTFAGYDPSVWVSKDLDSGHCQTIIC